MSDRDPSGLSMQERASLSRQLLDNPMFHHILIEMDNEATLTWRRSTSPQQREEQWHLVVAIAMLRKMVESRAENIKVIAERNRRQSRPPV